MSSLAAAKADNFYYPPDFDPKKHQTLNKYNGQHPLRERASKLDQGILVIRFEVPFNIWCDKCGEHIAKGERFNAEKKAIGQYHSTKVLQFSMTHHCGCKITIQTDPKRAEYLVVEGARKKEESYSAADAEVIELPDDAEKERRERDPLYRLEYQQGAKAKALSGAERLAAIQDMVDARSADTYSLNRAMRAALRGEKRASAALDAQRQELGLPEAVPLLTPSDGDALAAQVAFLTSSARASAGAEAHRKRILEQDIFTSAAGGAATAVRATAVIAGGGPAVAQPPPAKRPALGMGQVKVRAAAPVLSQEQTGRVEAGGAMQPEQQQQQEQQQAQQKQQASEGRAAPSEAPLRAAGGANACSSTGAQHKPCNATSASHASIGAPGSGPLMTAAAVVANSGGRPPPGAAALAAAAVRAATLAQAARKSQSAHASSGAAKPVGALRPAATAAHLSAGTSLKPVSAPSGGAGGAQKRSLKDRAAELQRRRQGLGGVGLTLSRPEL